VIGAVADRTYGVLFRSRPFQQGPTMAAALQDIPQDAETREVLELPYEQSAE
jgi:hypothetical protein